ncbi:MAG: DUF983 domain-containing protein [Pseudomonadota bacterium]
MTAEPIWWVAGLRCRCPQCGEGRIFNGFLQVKDQCDVCQFELGKHDSGDGPAFFVLSILCGVVTPIALIVNMNMTIPLWVNAVLWGAIILGATLAMLRPAFGLMIAVQYRSRAGSGEWDLPPDPREPGRKPAPGPDQRLDDPDDKAPNS